MCSTIATCGRPSSTSSDRTPRTYYEAVQTARLICKGFLYPTLSRVFPLRDGPEAFHMLHQGTHDGSSGFLNIAPEENMGIRDYALRERLGESRINMFRQERKTA